MSSWHRRSHNEPPLASWFMGNMIHLSLAEATMAAKTMSDLWPLVTGCLKMPVVCYYDCHASPNGALVIREGVSTRRVVVGVSALLGLADGGIEFPSVETGHAQTKIEPRRRHG